MGPTCARLGGALAVHWTADSLGGADGCTPCVLLSIDTAHFQVRHIGFWWLG